MLRKHKRGSSILNEVPSGEVQLQSLAPGAVLVQGPQATEPQRSLMSGHFKVSIAPFAVFLTSPKKLLISIASINLGPGQKLGGGSGPPGSGLEPPLLSTLEDT